MNMNLPGRRALPALSALCFGLACQAPPATPPPVEIRNLALPVAAISPSDPTVDVGQTVSLDGRGSHDPEGLTLSFQWTLRGKPAGSEAQLETPSAAQTSLVADRSGVYVIELIVRAGERASGAAVAVLTVTEPMLTANAGDDLTRSLGEWVILDGTASRDPQGGALGYRWSFTEQPGGSTAELFDPASATPRFLADLEGTYAVQLEVTAGARNASDEVRVTVGPRNHPPFAMAGPGQRVAIGATVQLSGASGDPDGDAVTLNWSVASQPPGANVALTGTGGTTATFVATTGGFYSFLFTVTDARGLVARALTRVIATPDASQSDLFDPGEVYIAGTLSEGTCSRDAIAHWLTPDSAATGFECNTDIQRIAIRPTDGRILYKRIFEQVLREFRCDNCPYAGDYPSSVLTNDVTVATPCPTQGEAMVRFKVSAQGMVLHTCGGSQDMWRDHSGTVVYEAFTAVPETVGYNGWILTKVSVVNAPMGASTVISGLPARTWITSRAADPQTFWVVLAPATPSSTPELWTISLDGAATLVGSYPPVPVGYISYAGAQGRLDGSGALLMQGRDNVQLADTIFRATVGATTDPVYSELDNPVVKLHGFNMLIGGP